MLGTHAKTAVQWLILLMVLCCDPAAIALTIAVAGHFGSLLNCGADLQINSSGAVYASVEPAR
jgi:hypothetical protein